MQYQNITINVQNVRLSASVQLAADQSLDQWSPAGCFTNCLWDVASTVTGQLADAIGDFACLVFLFGGICETASCPVRELAYPRVAQLPLQLIDISHRLLMDVVLQQAYHRIKVWAVGRPQVRCNKVWRLKPSLIKECFRLLESKEK